MESLNHFLLSPYNYGQFRDLLAYYILYILLS